MREAEDSQAKRKSLSLNESVLGVGEEQGQGMGVMWILG